MKMSDSSNKIASLFNESDFFIVKKFAAEHLMRYEFRKTNETVPSYVFTVYGDQKQLDAYREFLVWLNDV